MKITKWITPLLIPLIASAQTKPINNLVLQFSGSAPTLTYGLVAVDSSGAVYPINAAAGTRQSFAPSGTAPGLNVGSYAGDPSSLINGDLWYNSSSNVLRAQINGTTVSLGTGSGSPAGSNTYVQYNASGSFGANAGFTSNTSGDVTVRTLTSTVSTGTAPFAVSSATNVANLNASSLNGATFGAPGTIGGSTPGTVNFSTLTPSSNSAAAAAVVALTPTTVSDTESSNAVTINWASGPTHKLTLNGNLSTVTFSNQADGLTLVVYVTNTSSGYTVTWGNSIKWPGGSQPTQTATANTDRWVIQDIGGTLYGAVTQDY
jgi:hypothetical protein